ncbi:MAG: hypothetical protein WBF75_17630 [Pseudonocardiaceae bacterium]
MPERHCFRRVATLRAILGRRVRPPVTPVPAGTVVLTDGVTGAAHRVTREAFLAGNRYVALCGVRVLPLTLTAPARFHCPVCERST